MRVVVVGGGKVGYYLVRTLLDQKHQVSVIEKDPDRAAFLAGKLPALVIAGDGTNLAHLADAGADRADVLAAVTGLDEVNLVACQVGRTEFNVPRTVARVNNPLNRAILKQLGVDTVVSSTAIIAHVIEQETNLESLRELFTLEQGRLALVEEVIAGDSPAAGRSVRDLAPGLPEDSVLMAIVRGDRLVFPRGETVLAAGDKVLALTTTDNEDGLMAALGGRRRTARVAGRPAKPGGDGR
ncbi:MAG TPA: TrkA family potassium uptake protein [Bacillota bacterium]|jgi:trk system potassium uptake protein TrkA